MPLLDVDPIKIKPLQTHSRVIGLGIAVPASSFTQKQILDFVLTHLPIQDTTKTLYKKTLSNPSIKNRHFALNRLEDVLETDHTKILRRFETAASDLSKSALEKALQGGQTKKEQIDFLVTTTCTGYACPGLSSFIIEKAGLRNNIFTADLTGMGCGAALPALQQAHHFVRSNPGSTAAVISTEICSAAMFSNDAPDIVISNTLFSDGSACVLLKSEIDNSPWPRLLDFASLLIPEWREDLRFQNERGFLKNVLGKHVPQQSSTAAKKVIEALLQKNELGASDIDHWIVHPGGEKILNAIQQTLELQPAQLSASRVVLENHGNMSSPSVLFVLEERSRRALPQKGDKGVMVSFGAGFSAYAALLEY